MKAKELPPLSYLRECFDFDRETGQIFWKRRPRSHFKQGGPYQYHVKYRVGKLAGNLNADGYVTIMLDGVNYLGHRLAWFFYYGRSPAPGLEIDHIDGDPINNRMNNLRLVTKTGNAKNQKLSARNKSGKTGVHWVAKKKRWLANIGVSGKCIHLGMYTDKQEAIDAREKAERKYGFHENHGKRAG